MSKTYLNRSIFINEYCDGLMLSLVIFPKPYLVKKAIYFLKFKGLRYDLYFNNENYSLFYQDEKFIPLIDDVDMFNRVIRSDSFIKFDCLDGDYYLACEENFSIMLDNNKKGNIVLVFVSYGNKSVNSENAVT